MVTLQKGPPAANGKAASPPPGRMTEQQFLDWLDGDTRAEWVDGEVIVMPPMNDDHDDFAFWLRSVVQAFVQQKNLGRVKGPDFMLRLPRLRRRRVPDLFFVSRARAGIIRTNHAEGAPDLVMEIVSPESAARDWREKYLDYQKARVPEYWVIDRAAGRMEAYALSRAGKYHVIEEDDEGRVMSTVLKGFYLRPEWVLEKRLPRLGVVLKELGIRL
jgi:Uma2 family endonuclease